MALTSSFIITSPVETESLMESATVWGGEHVKFPAWSARVSAIRNLIIVVMIMIRIMVKFTLTQWCWEGPPRVRWSLDLARWSSWFKILTDALQQKREHFVGRLVHCTGS